MSQSFTGSTTRAAHSAALQRQENCASGNVSQRRYTRAAVYFDSHGEAAWMISILPLARCRFWREDVRWYGVGHDIDLADDSRSLAFALHGGSQQDIDIYVMINAYWEDLTFQIQEGAANAWRRVVDTSRESPFDFLEPGNESHLQSLHYQVSGRAVVVLVRDKDGG